MFIYLFQSGVRRLLGFFTPAYVYLISYFVRQFQRELCLKTGVDFRLTISYDRYSPDILLEADPTQPNDWQPQFRFAVRPDRKGILLYSLKFPSALRQKGIGRFCVRWLKAFCRRMGYQFIVLGAYPEAEGFWQKMKFRQVPYSEWKEYWIP